MYLDCILINVIMQFFTILKPQSKMKHFHLKNLLFLLFFLFGSELVNAQELEAVFSAGGANTETARAFYQDADGNFYVYLRASAGTIELFDSTYTKPQSFDEPSYHLLSKLDADLSVQWVYPFDFTTSLAESLNLITVDGEGSVYLTDWVKDTTYRFDPNGSLLWAKPFSGTSIHFTDEGLVELYGYEDEDNLIDGEEISNKSGTVVRIDADGNIISHFTVDLPEFPYEVIQGKNEFGYYGYRKTLVNVTAVGRYEVFICNEEGEVTYSKLINHNRSQYPIELYYDPVHSYYYATGYFIERTPINNPDDSLAISKSNLFILQLDTDLEISRVLKLSDDDSGIVAFPFVTLKLHEGNIYASGHVLDDEKFTHLGYLNYLDAEEDNLFYAKIDHTLNCKWFKVQPTTNFTNRLNSIMPYDGGVYLGGRTDYISDNGIELTTVGGNDLVILKVADNDSTTSYIGGKVFIDINQNGIDDDEPGKPYEIVLNDQSSAINYTNSEGYFELGADTGLNLVHSASLPQYWARSTPDSLFVEVEEYETLSDGYEFGIYPIPGIRDVEVVLTALTPARPGMDVLYKLRYRSNANDTISGQIILYQDSTLFYKEASVPPAVIADSLVWNYTDLWPGEYRDIIITDSLSSESNVFSNPLSLLAKINPIIGDTIPENNIDTTWHRVTASFDPNLIEVYPPCMDFDFFERNGPLEYQVYFQNTGNDTAFNVVIRDTLSDLLDINSFELIDVSHEANVSIENNVLIMHFENILLPDSNVNYIGSNGHFNFEIKTKAGLEAFDNIQNRAAIYFDYNAPIITNTINTYVPDAPDTMVVNSCNSYVSPSGLYTWTESGVYSDVLPGGGFCPELIKIDLTITPTTFSQSFSACDSVQFNDATYFFTETVMDLYPGEGLGGCDSLVITEIIIPNTSKMDAFSCGPYVSPSGNAVYETSGTYVDVIVGQDPCDEIITINLTIEDVDNSVVQEGSTLSANESNAVYQWIDCGMNDAEISGENEQEFIASGDGDYAVIVNKGTCADTSACYTVLTSGLGKEFNQLIQVFPNPSSGKIQVVLDRNYDEISVQIMNVLGQFDSQDKLKAKKEFELNLIGPDGLYLVKLVLDGKPVEFTVLKE